MKTPLHVRGSVNDGLWPIPHAAGLCAHVLRCAGIAGEFSVRQNYTEHTHPVDSIQMTASDDALQELQQKLVQQTNLLKQV